MLQCNIVLVRPGARVAACGPGAGDRPGKGRRGRLAESLPGN